MRKSFFETSRYKGNINDDDKEGLVDVFDSNNRFISKHLKFEHCRHVTLDNHGYMKCDCGWMSQYLAPCIHIMNILDDAEYIVPDLFHIRWWKQFNYYFDKPDIVPNLQDSLQTLFDDTNVNSFLPDGSFRGCNVTATGFLQKPLPSVETTDTVYQTICAVKLCIDTQGYLKRDSQVYKHFLMTSI